MYIDGASRGNPGESAYAFVVFGEREIELFRYGASIGVGTNNAAEYRALIEALKHINKNFTLKAEEPLTVFSDSELLVNQINGRYRVRSEKLTTLFHEVQSLLKELERKRIQTRIKHVSRERNKISDWIVNQVLDCKTCRPADRPREIESPEESPGS